MTNLYPTKSEYELLWITKDGEESLWIANTDYEDRKEASEQMCLVRGDRAEIVRKLEIMCALEPDHFAERVFAMLYRAEMDGHCISGYPDAAQYDSVTLCRRVTAYQCPPKCHKCGVFYKDEPVEGINLEPEMPIEYALDVLHTMLQMADVIAHTGEADKQVLNQVYGVNAGIFPQDRIRALQMAIDALEERRREEVRSLDD